MKHVFCLLLAAGLLAGATGCNKSSFIEGVGNATAQDPNTGRVAFYCTNTRLDRCTNRTLNVSVNSQLKGTIGGRASATPGCGGGGQSLSVTLDPGTYRITVEPASLDCLMSNNIGYNFSLTVKKGDCIAYELK